MTASPVGLRARKKEATATALQHAAFELFQTRGYDSTTVQDITAAAGVSQRTFFRYFPTKDAVLVIEHGRREHELQQFLATRPPESPGDMARAVVALLASDIEHRRDLVAAQLKVFASDPGLADRFSGHLDRLTVILAVHVSNQLGLSGPLDARPLLVGAQVVRSWTTAISLWIGGGMAGDLKAIAAGTLDTARCDPALNDVGT